MPVTRRNSPKGGATPDSLSFSGLVLASSFQGTVVIRVTAAYDLLVTKQEFFLFSVHFHIHALFLELFSVCYM